MMQRAQNKITNVEGKAKDEYTEHNSYNLSEVVKSSSSLSEEQLHVCSKQCVQESKYETKYDVHCSTCDVLKSTRDVEIRKMELDNEIRKIELKNQEEQSKREHCLKMAELRVRKIEALIKFRRCT